MDSMARGSPVFVKIDEYKDILDVIALLKSKISEAKSILGKINEIKNAEDKEIETWANELDEVERKLYYIDRTLLEPESL